MMKTREALANFAIVLVLVWVGFPLFWQIISSFKDNGTIFQFPPPVLFQPVLDAYSAIFSARWASFFLNSAIVSVGGVLLAMLVGLPGAYALARFNLSRKDFTMLSILSVRMMPAIVVIIPYFLVFIALGLIDNFVSLILVYATFGIPYVVWIMKGFIEQIPRAADEAAQLDGAGIVRIFLDIILPLSKPGLVVTAFLCFVQGWNDFIFAFVLTNLNQTVPIGLASLFSSRQALWNQMFAVGALNMIPAFALAYITRKYWARGLTLGIVKG